MLFLFRFYVYLNLYYLIKCLKPAPTYNTFNVSPKLLKILKTKVKYIFPILPSGCRVRARWQSNVIENAHLRNLFTPSIKKK